MLRAGGSLTEVGQVLRHRGRDVTSIYAKVDRLALVQVVQPWPGSSGMSDLAEHVENYLTVRRALGFKLVGEGVLLAEFVACAEAVGQSTVTTEFALAWARRPASGSRNYLSRRLRAVRSFARYLHALDPACEIPPIELLPASKYRPAPYLYSDRRSSR